MRLIRSLFLSLSFLVNGLYKIADIEVFDARGKNERFCLCGTGGIEVDDLVDSVGDAGETIGELLKEFRLGDVLEGLAGVELFCFVRLGFSHGLHRSVDVLEARALCRGHVGLCVLCVFVSARNVIYPDVGEGFVEAVSGDLQGGLLIRFVGKGSVFDVYRLRFFLRGSLWRRSGSEWCRPFLFMSRLRMSWMLYWGKSQSMTATSYPFT